MADYERALKLKPNPAVDAMRAAVYHGQKDYAKAKATDSFGNKTTVKEPIDGENLPMYQPVDWLFDNTPFGNHSRGGHNSAVWSRHSASG